MKKRKYKYAIRLLLDKYRSLFPTPQDENCRPQEDFSQVERKFLRYALEQRRIEIQEDLFE